MQITINRDGQQYGPYPLEDATAHLATGGLLPTDWAWAEGMTEWAPLGDVIAAAQAQAATPAPAPAPPAMAQPAAVHPAAAQPAAVHPGAAQAGGLVSPAQLSTGASLASPSQLSTSPTGSARPMGAKKTDPTPSPAAEPAAGTSESGLKRLLAGKGKLVFAVCGIAVSAVVIVMQLTGGEEVIDVVEEKVNQPAANAALEALKPLGPQFDYDVNEQVSSVTISDKTISAMQMSSLLELKNLQRVSLVKCGVDDSAIQGFKSLSKLTFLDVSGNPKVTDECIDSLTAIPTLTTLNASGTSITSVGADKLKKALPDCTVNIQAETPAQPEQ